MLPLCLKSSFAVSVFQRGGQKDVVSFMSPLVTLLVPRDL